MIKKLILKTALFAALVVVCDVCLGLIFDNITEKITAGGLGKDNYICKEMKDDIVIFGSSRASHHYDTKVLADSLGMSAYNCGEDGCGILLACARLSMARERYQPKIVIFDVVPGYDVQKGEGSDFKWMKRWIGNNTVDNIIEDTQPKEKYKLVSSAYKYNSSFLKNILIYITGFSVEPNFNGYKPLKKKMKAQKEKTIKGELPIDNDSIKLKYMKEFIKLAKGSHVYFVKSPIWYESDSIECSKALPAKELCQREGITFIDFTNSKKYLHQDKYFSDGKHLNETGAEEFTKDLVAEIKKYENKYHH